MGKITTPICLSKTTKKLLLQRKNETGRSMSELTEYAIINMPYVPPKKMVKIKKDDE